MYIAVCDDQEAELDALLHLLDVYQTERKTVLRIKTFRNAAALLDAAEKEHFTLYLLDIMMPGIDGLSAARDIRSFDETVEIVFLTSTPTFAYESYGVKALGYLLKPIQADGLFTLLDKLLLQKQKPEEGLMLKQGATLIRILFSQLIFVEVNGKHLLAIAAQGLFDGMFHFIDGNARPVADLLVLSGQRIVHGCFAGIWVAGQCNSHSVSSRIRFP